VLYDDEKRGEFENLSNNHICKMFLFQVLTSVFRIGLPVAGLAG